MRAIEEGVAIMNTGTPTSRSCLTLSAPVQSATKTMSGSSAMTGSTCSSIRTGIFAARVDTLETAGSAAKDVTATSRRASTTGRSISSVKSVRETILLGLERRTSMCPPSSRAARG
jgi:hypothetical protein